MNYLRLTLAVTLTYVMCSCGAKNATANETECVEAEVATNDSTTNVQDYSDLIKTVYDKFVFYNDADTEAAAHPEEYFTANALKKLKDSFEYDCEDGDCYAYDVLRTQAQDSKPGSDEKSEIISIDNVGDNWYEVNYTDMGWSGMTLIKIADGKIDDFKRCLVEFD